MIQTKLETVPAPLSGERFDVVAAAVFAGFSRKKIKLIIDSGGAYHNKRRVRVAKEIVKAGDRIELFWDDKIQVSLDPTVPFAPKKSRMSAGDIVFENEDFLVANKPAGLPSQATLVSSTDTIIHELEALDKVKYKVSELFLVHRLDKDTSGLMIIAKNTLAQRYFEKIFHDKKVKKVYEALCFNFPETQKGLITFPLLKDGSRKNTFVPLMRATGRLPSDAKSAETDFVVVETFQKTKASLIRCYPQTGRTHQIRVHLMAIGCPILGDKTYAQGIVGHSLNQIALRHMLHARSLDFVGPDNNAYHFEAEYPADFMSCLGTVKQLNA